MNDRQEVAPGVGEGTVEHVPTELLDYIATQGLRTAYLAASDLRVVAGTHPLEFPNASSRAQALQRLIAFMEHGLEQAGYEPSRINRVPSSSVRPSAHDPKTPRTNT